MLVQFCDQTSREGLDPSYAYHSEQKKRKVHLGKYFGYLGARSDLQL